MKEILVAYNEYELHGRKGSAKCLKNGEIAWTALDVFTKKLPSEKALIDFHKIMMEITEWAKEEND